MEGSNDINQNNSCLMAVIKAKRTSSVSFKVESDVSTGGNWAEAVI